MDFSQLQNFITIARLGNLTKAAEMLHISQPAMSSSLSRLEDELHTHLFDRNGRRLILNEKGQIFYDFADKVLEEQKDLITKLKTVSEGREKLTLYLVDSLGVDTALATFQQMYPDCMIRLIEIERKNIQEALLREDCDFVIDIFMKAPTFTCEYDTICTDDFYIAVSDRNPLFKRDSLRLDELQDESFVTLPRDESYLSIADELCLEAGFRRRIEAQCFRSQLYSYLINSKAISFASSSQQNDPSLALFADRIRLIPIETSHKINSMLLWKKHKPLSRSAAQFLALCRENYAMDLTSE